MAAAVAGMIAIVGTGVDAQIIITDEMLARRGEATMHTVLGNAYYIIWADALLLCLAMMPLFFSTSLVAGDSAMGQETSDRRRWPVQLGRMAIVLFPRVQ